MRLSVILNCITQVGGSRVTQKIQRLKKFQRLLEEYPAPSHYKGVKDLDLPWIAGFLQGDGCVTSYLRRNKRSKFGVTLQNVLQLNQSNKSYYIMKDISNYYPLVGENNYQIYEENLNYNSIKISSYRQLCIAFTRLKGLLVGDKWFNFAVCNYATQLMERGYGKDFQSTLMLAKYIVQNQKEYHNNTSKNLQHRTRVQEQTQNQKDVLQEMEQQAELQGICVPDVSYNEIIPQFCYQPSFSLNERFVLGFVEAEGCFHIQLILKTAKHPLIFPRLVFFIPQKGLKNRFILQDILNKLGGKGSLTPRKLGIILEDSKYDLSIRDQQYIREYVVPFFQRNMPTTSKYFDFAKFTEICWGNHAGKHKCQTWVEQAIHSIFSMNNTVDTKKPQRNHSIQQYLFYLSLTNNQKDATRKKRNIKIYKILIFDWIKKWKNLNSGTNIQKKSAKAWFESLQPKDLQLHLDDYADSSVDVIRVLNFVASYVSQFEQTDEVLKEDVDYLWFYSYSQSNSSMPEMKEMKCRPFKIIEAQINPDSKNNQ